MKKFKYEVVFTVRGFLAAFRDTFTFDRQMTDDELKKHIAGVAHAKNMITKNDRSAVKITLVTATEVNE